MRDILKLPRAFAFPAKAMPELPAGALAFRPQRKTDRDQKRAFSLQRVNGRQVPRRISPSLVRANRSG